MGCRSLSFSSFAVSCNSKTFSLCQRQLRGGIGQWYNRPSRAIGTAQSNDRSSAHGRHSFTARCFLHSHPFELLGQACSLTLAVVPPRAGRRAVAWSSRDVPSVPLFPSRRCCPSPCDSAKAGEKFAYVVYERFLGRRSKCKRCYGCRLAA